MNRDSTIDFRAFAVVTESKVIYTSYFWPFFYVKIEYPVISDEIEIPDKRNDQLFLDIMNYLAASS